MNRNVKERAEASAAAVAPVAQASDGRIPVPDRYAAKFQVCLDQAAEAPDQGGAVAQHWRNEGGGFYARNSLGFAYARAEPWPTATVPLEQGASETERTGEKRQSARMGA